MEPNDPRIRLIGRAAWQGLEVNVTLADPGRFEAEPRPEHRLMIHLGAPARVTCRDGTTRKRYVQRRGDMDLIPAGSSPVFEDGDPTSLLGIWICPDLLAAAAAAMTRPDSPALMQARIHERDEQIFQLALMLKHQVESERPSDLLFVDSIAMALIARLLEEFGVSRPMPRAATLSRQKLKATLEYIEEHLGEEIRLSDLAELTRLSASHFRVLFRQTVHRPVHAYVLERRVCRARSLIEGGAASISQVALESGFCHQSHMARHMRRLLGLSPSEVARLGASAIAARQASIVRQSQGAGLLPA